MLWRGQMEYSMGTAHRYLKYLDALSPHHIHTSQHANLSHICLMAWPVPWRLSSGKAF